jgi:predicted secreted protein
MSCFAGKNGVITADGSAIAQLTSYTINENADTSECTHFDSADYRSYRTTFKSWDGSCDLVWDRQDGDLVVGNEYALIVYPEGNDTSTDWKISGTIIITSFEISAATEDNVTASCSFQGNGVLARAEEV